MHPVASLENAIPVRRIGYFADRTVEMSFFAFNISFYSLADELIRDSINSREDIWQILRQLDTEHVPRNGYFVGPATNVRHGNLINEAQGRQNIADKSVF